MDTAYSSLNAVAARGRRRRTWSCPTRTTWTACRSRRLGRCAAALAARQARTSREFEADNGVLTAWQSQLGNYGRLKAGDWKYVGRRPRPLPLQGRNNELVYKLGGHAAGRRVHLRAIVTRISVTDTGADVTLADGKSFTGDDVIRRVPSVWQKIPSRRSAAFAPADGLEREIPSLLIALLGARRTHAESPF